MVNVYRIEYEILPSLNPWVAFIAAFGHEEANRHLQAVVGKPIRITSTGMHSRLDDISAEVRMNVVNAFMSKKGAQQKKVAKEPVDEEKKEVKQTAAKKN